MANEKLKCPQCGHEFDMPEAIAERIQATVRETTKAELESGHEASLAHARSDAERRCKEETDTLKLALRQRELLVARIMQTAKSMLKTASAGHPEAQGEALEEHFEDLLRRAFPGDRIVATEKGVRGGDVLQGVCNESGQECGRILWETKNTKTWQAAWLEKIKADEKDCKADAAVIVSQALPDHAKEHGAALKGGVWIANLGNWYPLAAVLRECVLEAARLRQASAGSGKKDAVLEFVSSSTYRKWVMTLLDHFTELQEQIERERRTMEKHWAERDRRLRELVKRTCSIHGELGALTEENQPDGA